MYDKNIMRISNMVKIKIFYFKEEMTREDKWHYSVAMFHRFIAHVQLYMFIISERYQLNICKHKQQLNDLLIERNTTCFILNNISQLFYGRHTDLVKRYYICIANNQQYLFVGFVLLNILFSV